MIKLPYNTLTIIQFYCKKAASYLRCVLFEFPLHMSLTMTTSSPIHSSQFYIYSLLFVFGSLEAEDMTEAGLRTSTFELWSTLETIKFLLITFKKCPTFGYTSLILRIETGRKSLKASQKLEDDCFTWLYIYHTLLSLFFNFYHYYCFIVLTIEPNWTVSPSN